MGREKSISTLKYCSKENRHFLIQSVPVRPSTQALFNINVFMKYHQPSTLTSGL